MNTADSRATVAMKRLPIFVGDTPVLTVFDIRARARQPVRQHSGRVLMVDYLQLMDTPGSDSRQLQISEITRGLKLIARELNVPIVVLSQLNRQSEPRDNRRPRMSDLRESGAIDQAADVICLLHREDYYRKSDANYIPTNLAEVIVAKQRNGPTGGRSSSSSTVLRRRYGVVPQQGCGVRRCTPAEGRIISD